MNLELTEEETVELHEILGDEQLRAIANLDKAASYQFHDEMKKWRRRFKIADRLHKRMRRP